MNTIFYKNRWSKNLGLASNNNINDLRSRLIDDGIKIIIKLSFFGGGARLENYIDHKAINNRIVHTFTQAVRKSFKGTVEAKLSKDHDVLLPMQANNSGHIVNEDVFFSFEPPRIFQCNQIFHAINDY